MAPKWKVAGPFDRVESPSVSRLAGLPSFRQTRIVRAKEYSELFEIDGLLAKTIPPLGPKVTPARAGAPGNPRRRRPQGQVGLGILPGLGIPLESSPQLLSLPQEATPTAR